jgi:hypothetical protein
MMGPARSRIESLGIPGGLLQAMKPPIGRGAVNAETSTSPTHITPLESPQQALKLPSKGRIADVLAGGFHLGVEKSHR